MMQFCSTRQFISCLQTLVPLQLPAAVLPADAAQPLTSTFTKVMEAASAPTWLPSLEEQDRLNNRAPRLPGTPTDDHIQPPRANTVRGGGAPVPVVFRDSLPAPCRREGGGVMEPINRRREHERSGHLYVSRGCRMCSSSILCGDLEIWNVQAVFSQ